MEFELPKINVSFEYDEEKDEMVFVINGVEKRVKTEDMITEMEKLQEQNTALEQQPCEDCISREEVCDYIAEFVNHEYATDREREMVKHIIGGIQHLTSIQPNKWISTSERMPEDGEECIITIRERWGEDEEWDYEEPTTAYYQNGKWSPSYDVDEGQEWEVIAWMPLPEPYKAESEDKE